MLSDTFHGSGIWLPITVITLVNSTNCGMTKNGLM